MLLPWATLHIFQVFYMIISKWGTRRWIYVIYMCANLRFKKVCAWKLREHFKTWHIIAPCLGGAVFISRHPPRCAFVFQSGAGDPYQALSIIPLTCHHGNPHPTQGRPAGARVQTKTPEVWMDVNLNGRKNHNRAAWKKRWQVTSKDGAKGKERREGGQRGNRRVTGDCCRGSERKEMAGRRKDEQMHWYSTQESFFTLEGKPLTLNFPVHLSPSGFIWCHVRMRTTVESKTWYFTNSMKPSVKMASALAELALMVKSGWNIFKKTITRKLEVDSWKGLASSRAWRLKLCIERL